MGWMAIAAPYIAQGVGALSSYLSSRNAGKRGPEEQLALGGAQGVAGQLQQQGTNLLSTVQGPRNYWESLLSGNRAQMAQATAGPRGAIEDVYRGAARGLDQAGVRGAQRDVAMGDLIREKAAKMAGLVSGVQPQAATALTGIAEMGPNLLATSGNLWGNLLGQGTANRQDADRQKGAAGKTTGQFLFNLASGLAQAYGKGGSSGGGMTWGGTTDPSAA